MRCRAADAHVIYACWALDGIARASDRGSFDRRPAPESRSHSSLALCHPLGNHGPGLARWAALTSLAQAVAFEHKGHRFQAQLYSCPQVPLLAAEVFGFSGVVMPAPTSSTPWTAPAKPLKGAPPGDEESARPHRFFSLVIVGWSPVLGTHNLGPFDVPEFAVRLAGLVIISLTLPGSPGEFVAQFNDIVSYDCKWLIEDVIGCAQCWTVVCPELIPHLPSRFTQGQLAMSRSQKGASKDVIYLLVEGSNEAEVGRKWEEFWGSLGFVRLQLEVLFQTNFGATFEKLLPVRERLAAPGQVGKSRITGGDATLSRIGAVDWTSKVLIAQEEPNFLTTEDDWLPQPYGRVKGFKCLVQKRSGPACVLLLQSRAKYEVAAVAMGAWNVKQKVAWTPRSQLTVSSARIAEEAKDHELEMRARLFGKSREFFSSSSQRAEAQSLTELDRVAQEAVLSKLADSTHRSYGSGKKQWEIFMSEAGAYDYFNNTPVDPNVDPMHNLTQEEREEVERPVHHRPAVPRLKASNGFRNDPLVQEDADARYTYAQQWRRHKSRLRAIQHQMAKGTVDLYPKSRAAPPKASSSTEEDEPESLS
ncbi:unnamed protein product [Symbiodinium sp. KB8]|nr:unnamed protein product [Symbiodinium sp. KB8]